MTFNVVKDKNRTDRVDDFLKLLRQVDVREVERLGHHICKVAALVGIVVGNEIKITIDAEAILDNS